MSKCISCGKVKESKSQYCLNCWDKKIKSDKFKYGTKICPRCRKTIITKNWTYCVKCNKK